MTYTLHRRSLELQGQTRKYLVVEPESLPSRPDVLFFFHGSLQSGNVLRRFTNNTFDALAERTGTIVVYPNGVDHHFSDCRGTLPTKTRELGIDDVAFTREMLTRLKDEYGVGRTFACGYSNGGQMVLRLLIDAPGLLNGACIFASTFGAGSNHAPSNPDSAYEPTPVLLMHGTADPLAPYDGGVAGVDASQTRGEVLSAPETAARLAKWNGAEGPVEERVYADIVKQCWTGDFSVELWTMEGIGHVIPSGNELDARLGKNTTSFQAADVVERFFGL